MSAARDPFASPSRGGSAGVSRWLSIPREGAARRERERGRGRGAEGTHVDLLSFPSAATLRPLDVGVSEVGFELAGVAVLGDPAKL